MFATSKYQNVESNEMLPRLYAGFFYAPYIRIHQTVFNPVDYL